VVLSIEKKTPFFHSRPNTMAVAHWGVQPMVIPSAHTPEAGFAWDPKMQLLPPLKKNNRGQS